MIFANYLIIQIIQFTILYNNADII